MTAVADAREAAGARRGQDDAARAAHRAERDARRARTEARRDRAFRVVRSALRWLPLPVASVLGQVFGNFAWLAAGTFRRQTLRNLELALGAETTPAARRRIGRRSFALAGRGLFAWLVLHRMGTERALRRATWEPSPEAVAALREGGAVLVTMHSGLFDLGGALLAREIGMVAVGRDAADAATSLLIEMRRDLGLRTIEQGSPREIVRALKEGGKVVMLVDQDIRGVNGAFVPFFGRLANTPLGPATMAVRLGLPIVCVRTEWRSLTTHAVCADVVLRAREDLAGEEAVLDLTARCSAAVESAIRRRPDEWLWVHDRWRTSPEDRPEAPVWPREAAP